MALTNVVGRCWSGCGRKFYVLEVCLENWREDHFGEEWTDEQIAASLDFCESCATGEVVPGEHDVPADPTHQET